jgi:hypothetical protein
MIKIKLIWVIMLLVVALIIGALAGKLISIPHFEVDPKINVLHAISILTPLLVAIVVGVMLDQQKESNKIKRDLILRRIDDLYETVNELHDTLDQPKDVLLTEINKKLKAIGTHGISIRSIIKAANFRESSHIDSYNESHKILKNKLTMTDITENETSVTPGILVKEGKCTYSEARFIEIEKNIGNLRKHIFNIQVDVASSQ